MAARRGVSSPSSSGEAERPPAKRSRHGLRGRRWIITLNDRLECPSSRRWVEEAEAVDARVQDVDRAHAAACGSQEEEAGQGAAADARPSRLCVGEVGDRKGHFCHPSEIEPGLREHEHLSYYCGQLERGPENGKDACCYSLGTFPYGWSEFDSHTPTLFVLVVRRIATLPFFAGVRSTDAVVDGCQALS